MTSCCPCRQHTSPCTTRWPTGSAATSSPNSGPAASPAPPFDVVTVAESPAPITTMGGVRVLPDRLLADLDPAESALLVLPGADLFDAGGGDAFTAAAARLMAAGVPVAAICGATAGLARAGLLDTGVTPARPPSTWRPRGTRAASITSTRAPSPPTGW